ncbi:type II toxin-antitoxin system RelE/ParE family toxin [Bradyrhizobium sp. Ash2021]|uniref:type II toxin-antitoxin system RelE/ParE family toxin n=1 Tax=Bradyrhizobium sp. Ash2021 TaxID=2954771 RepID=UPI002814D684|nr:type II toxin-antitoxin system RelE/ParE family toxin [Bradyrhizobium sp. Ash2021]WMT78269.1 type II toxin-antitoxin system RelE/ParE family toxin [Bradyrhizobium sp. Ash2021]
MAYTSGVARRFITVAETPLFIRQSQDIWDDAEREAFIDFISRNPEEGDLIPETGGVRKIRWARPGSGKRGGARVVYFYHSGNRPLYLLMVYVKARQENLTAEEKKVVRKLAAILKS